MFPFETVLKTETLKNVDSVPHLTLQSRAFQMWYLLETETLLNNLKF